jgi:hypothetical protein
VAEINVLKIKDTRGDKMKIKFIVLFAMVLLLSISIQAQTKKDETEAVRQAATDYIESVYDINPELVGRSVHPDLVKLGFYMQDGEYVSAKMTYDQLYKLAVTYNKNGQIPKDAVKKVEILDLSDQTATAKVTAHWGIDYMQLAKFDGKWKIIHILWQSPPKKLD